MTSGRDDVGEGNEEHRGSEGHQEGRWSGGSRRLPFCCNVPGVAAAA